jgi:hypothetical protein
MPIHVINSFEQPTHSRQGEQSQEQDFAQEIEQMDTNVVQLELDQDIDHMPQNQ